MKSLFRKWFEPKYETSPLNMGEILSKRELVVLILPPELDVSFQLFTYLASWDYLFLSYQIFCSEKLLLFFKQLSFHPRSEFLQYGDFLPLKNAVVCNFWRDCEFREDIALSENSLLFDIHNSFNIELLPFAKSELNFLQNIAQLLSFPFQQKKVKIKAIRDHSYFLNNDDPHIVLHITNEKNASYYESIIKILKQDFSLNFYLTGIPYDGDAFIHVQNIPDVDVFQLYLVATNCDLFISDDVTLLRIFHKFSQAMLYFGKPNTFTDIPCLQPKDVFELKNQIQEMLPHKNLGGFDDPITKNTRS